MRPPVRRGYADDELRAAAIECLANDGLIHADHIHVRVSGCYVTLTGYVRDAEHRARAAADVAQLHGVRGVADQLEVL